MTNRSDFAALSDLVSLAVCSLAQCVRYAHVMWCRVPGDLRVGRLLHGMTQLEKATEVNLVLNVRRNQRAY